MQELLLVPVAGSRFRRSLVAGVFSTNSCGWVSGSNEVLWLVCVFDEFLWLGFWFQQILVPVVGPEHNDTRTCLL